MTDIVIPIDRIPEDMIIEIMKKIPGIPLERTKQVNRSLLRVAEGNAKAISAVGTQRGLKVQIYVDRWQQDKLRLGQIRNYAPDYTVDDIEMKMKALPISNFLLNFMECEEVQRYEDLIEVLKNVQPTCCTMEIKGIPTEYLERIMKFVDCKQRISIEQKGTDHQLFLNTLNQSPIAEKLHLKMSNTLRDEQIAELFSQIKKFHSFSREHCNLQTFHDLIFDLKTATDYGNLKHVSLNMDYNNHGANAYDNPNLPEMHKIWDNQPVPEKQRKGPSAIRKLETKTKFILITEGSNRNKEISILDKKYSVVLKSVLRQLQIENLSEEKQEEFCNLTTTDERRTAMILEAFLAKPEKTERN